MANEEHVKALKSGVTQWNKYVTSKGGNNFKPDLEGLKLKAGFDLTGYNLKHANLRESDLIGTNLTSANLTSADLTKANLNSAVLNEIVLEKAIMSGSDFRGATLRGANLTDANSVIKSAQRENSSSEKYKRYSEWVDVDGTNFQNADLSNAILVGGFFEGSNFQGATLINAKLGSANIQAADFTIANLSGAKLSNTFAIEADLRGANLRGTDFANAEIRFANLEDAEFNQDTSLKNLKSCYRCKIEIIALESLGPDYGGLSLSNRQELMIRDDSADLRFQFGGWKKLISMVAIMTFFLPYILFLANAKLTSTIAHKVDFPFEEHETQTILFGLWEYFIYGGHDKSNLLIYVMIPIAIMMLSYNTVRIVLFQKSAELETKKDITGIPPEFSFRDTIRNQNPDTQFGKKIQRILDKIIGKPSITYGHLFKALNYMLYGAIAVTVVQSLIFILNHYPPGPELWNFIQQSKTPTP